MIPTQKEYEEREAREFLRQQSAPELLTKAEKSEARKEFAAAMAHTPALVADRVSWLLAGSYGYGSYQAARRVAVNVLMTREAWMVQIIGALEWQCSRAATRSAWKELTKAQQQALNAAVLAAIAEHLQEQADEAGHQAAEVIKQARRS